MNERETPFLINIFKQKIMKNEIWKPVKGYEGLYEVSNFGRVRSFDRVVVDKNGRKLHYSGKIMTQNKTFDGYPNITLGTYNNKRTITIHRLVAEAFIPNPLNLPQVNHKDEDITNNVCTNLEWCDNGYNVNYGTGNQKRRINSSKNKKIIQLTLNGDFVAEWQSLREAERHGFNHGNISQCLTGRIGTYKGFIWKYA